RVIWCWRLWSSSSRQSLPVARYRAFVCTIGALGCHGRSASAGECSGGGHLRRDCGGAFFHDHSLGFPARQSPARSQPHHAQRNDPLRFDAEARQIETVAPRIHKSMIPKSGHRFSEKIMLQEKVASRAPPEARGRGMLLPPLV